MVCFAESNPGGNLVGANKSTQLWRHPNARIYLKVDCCSEVSNSQQFLSKQRDQIGRFLKILDNKFAYKSSPKRLLTFGLFWKRAINVKITVDILRQLVETFG